MVRTVIPCLAGAVLLPCLPGSWTPAWADRKPAPVEFRRGAPASGGFEAEARKAQEPPPVEYRRPQTAQPAQDVWSPGGGAPLSTWALRPGEAAPFDPRSRPQSHTVAAGETLFSLSIRYQIPLRGLIEANRLDAPFAIEPGQRLQIPPARMHLVAQGETLVTVARAYNIDARSLALLNRLPKPYLVRAGDKLALPALARAASEGRPTGSGAPKAGAPPAEPAPPGPTSGRTRFAWPLMGPLLTRFGAQNGGKRSDGVDIAAAPGAPVKAAADGRVVYGGDDIAGYGNLLLVQHAGGLISAYAHCAQFVVREGEQVRQGQTLARVAGSETGRPKLHFQVRTVAGDPTDPLSVLPPI